MSKSPEEMKKLEEEQEKARKRREATSSSSSSSSSSNAYASLKGVEKLFSSAEDATSAAKKIPDQAYESIRLIRTNAQKNLNNLQSVAESNFAKDLLFFQDIQKGFENLTGGIQEQVSDIGSSLDLHAQKIGKQVQKKIIGKKSQGDRGGESSTLNELVKKYEVKITDNRAERPGKLLKLLQDYQDMFRPENILDQKAKEKVEDKFKNTMNQLIELQNDMLTLVFDEILRRPVTDSGYLAFFQMANAMLIDQHHDSPSENPMIQLYKMYGLLRYDLLVMIGEYRQITKKLDETRGQIQSHSEGLVNQIELELGNIEEKKTEKDNQFLEALKAYQTNHQKRMDKINKAEEERIEKSPDHLEKINKLNDEESEFLKRVENERDLNAQKFSKMESVLNNFKIFISKVASGKEIVDEDMHHYLTALAAKSEGEIKFHSEILNKLDLEYMSATTSQMKMSDSDIEAIGRDVNETLDYFVHASLNSFIKTIATEIKRVVEKSKGVGSTTSQRIVICKLFMFLLDNMFTSMPLATGGAKIEGDAGAYEYLTGTIYYNGNEYGLMQLMNSENLFDNDERHPLSKLSLNFQKAIQPLRSLALDTALELVNQTDSRIQEFLDKKISDLNGETHQKNIIALNDVVSTLITNLTNEFGLFSTMYSDLFGSSDVERLRFRVNHLKVDNPVRALKQILVTLEERIKQRIEMQAYGEKDLTLADDIIRYTALRTSIENVSNDTFGTIELNENEWPNKVNNDSRFLSIQALIDRKRRIEIDRILVLDPKKIPLAVEEFIKHYLTSQNTLIEPLGAKSTTLEDILADLVERILLNPKTTKYEAMIDLLGDKFKSVAWIHKFLHKLPKGSSEEIALNLDDLFSDVGISSDLTQNVEKMILLALKLNPMIAGINFGKFSPRQAFIDELISYNEQVTQYQFHNTIQPSMSPTKALSRGIKLIMERGDGVLTLERERYSGAIKKTEALNLQTTQGQASGAPASGFAGLFKKSKEKASSVAAQAKDALKEAKTSVTGIKRLSDYQSKQNPSFDDLSEIDVYKSLYENGFSPSRIYKEDMPIQKFAAYMMDLYAVLQMGDDFASEMLILSARNKASLVDIKHWLALINDSKYKLTTVLTILTDSNTVDVLPDQIRLKLMEAVGDASMLGGAMQLSEYESFIKNCVTSRLKDVISLPVNLKDGIVSLISTYLRFFNLQPDYNNGPMLYNYYLTLTNLLSVTDLKEEVLKRLIESPLFSTELTPAAKLKSNLNQYKGQNPEINPIAINQSIVTAVHDKFDAAIQENAKREIERREKVGFSKSPISFRNYMAILMANPEHPQQHSEIAFKWGLIQYLKDFTLDVDFHQYLRVYSDYMKDKCYVFTFEEAIDVINSLMGLPVSILIANETAIVQIIKQFPRIDTLTIPAARSLNLLLIDFPQNPAHIEDNSEPKGCLKHIHEAIASLLPTQAYETNWRSTIGTFARFSTSVQLKAEMDSYRRAAEAAKGDATGWEFVVEDNDKLKPETRALIQYFKQKQRDPGESEVPTEPVRDDSSQPSTTPAYQMLHHQPKNRGFFSKEKPILIDLMSQVKKLNSVMSMVDELIKDSENKNTPSIYTKCKMDNSNFSRPGLTAFVKDLEAMRVAHASNKINKEDLVNFKAALAEQYNEYFKRIVDEYHDIVKKEMQPENLKGLNFEDWDTQVKCLKAVISLLEEMTKEGIDNTAASGLHTTLKTNLKELEPKSKGLFSHNPLGIDTLTQFVDALSPKMVQYSKPKLASELLPEIQSLHDFLDSMKSQIKGKSKLKN
jgi:hypothetical protein